MSTPEHDEPRAEESRADRPAGPLSYGPPVADQSLPPTSATPSVPEPAPAPEPPPGAAPTAAPVDEEASTEDSARRDRDDRARSVEAFPVPTGPRSTGFGGHLLGILVGLVLTLLAGFLVVLGQSRILAQGVGLAQDEVSPETLGIVLVTLGAVVAALVVLLGLWTPAAPFTGGLVTVAVGAAFLFAPIQAHRETFRLIATQQNRTAVLNSITVGTSGGLFLTGILLLAAGTAFSIVRRRGLALGAFRERSHVSETAH